MVSRYRVRTQDSGPGIGGDAVVAPNRLSQGEEHRGQLGKLAGKDNAAAHNPERTPALSLSETRRFCGCRRSSVTDRSFGLLSSEFIG